MLDWFDYNLMKANPDKFQVLAIGKKSFDHKIVFELKVSIFKVFFSLQKCQVIGQ
jgi:hypothetical protein